MTQHFTVQADAAGRARGTHDEPASAQRPVGTGPAQGSSQLCAPRRVDAQRTARQHAGLRVEIDLPADTQHANASIHDQLFEVGNSEQSCRGSAARQGDLDGRQLRRCARARRRSR